MATKHTRTNTRTPTHAHARRAFFDKIAEHMLISKEQTRALPPTRTDPSQTGRPAAPQLSANVVGSLVGRRSAGSSRTKSCSSPLLAQRAIGCCRTSGGGPPIGATAMIADHPPAEISRKSRRMSGRSRRGRQGRSCWGGKATENRPPTLPLLLVQAVEVETGLASVVGLRQVRARRGLLGIGTPCHLGRREGRRRAPPWTHPDGRDTRRPPPWPAGSNQS